MSWLSPATFSVDQLCNARCAPHRPFISGYHSAFGRISLLPLVSQPPETLNAAFYACTNCRRPTGVFVCVCSSFMRVLCVWTFPGFSLLVEQCVPLLFTRVTLHSIIYTLNYTLFGPRVHDWQSDCISNYAPWNLGELWVVDFELNSSNQSPSSSSVTKQCSAALFLVYGLL